MLYYKISEYTIAFYVLYKKYRNIQLIFSFHNRLLFVTERLDNVLNYISLLNNLLLLRRMFSDPVFDLFGPGRCSYFNLGSFIGAVHKSRRYHRLENMSVVSR